MSDISQVKIGSDTYDIKDTTARNKTEINDTTASANTTYSSNKINVLTAGEEIASTATGTSITLTDSAGGYVQDLRIYGRTESGSSVGDNGLTVQTIGKNLLKITINDIKPNNVGGTWTGNVYEYQGITYTFEETNGYVSAIILNGTSTSITGLRGISSIIMPENVYVLSGVPNGTAETFNVGLYTNANEDPRWSYYVINNHSAFQGISTPNKWNTIGHLMYVGIYVNEDIELTNLRFELMYTTVENYELDPAFEPYCSTSATVTTALPLRSNGDVKDEIDFADGQVITRIDSSGNVLATPVVTPLTSTEINAFRALRTFDGATNIDATDAPTMTVDYLLNTNNGQAVANLDNKIKSGFDELKKESEHFVYAFYIDHNDTNPATCVHPYISKYGCDNYFYIPAKMNYTTGIFDYGSWRDFVYRIAKPCMVAYNGHVDYYLDPDDYSSKIDGYGVSDIDDMSYAGNVMVELDCLYFKRWKANNKSYVVISDQKLDKSFKAYAHHDKNGKVLEHIYLGAYNGSYDGTRLRSISDIECHNLNALTTNKIMSNTTRQQEMDFAMANNVQGEAGEGWFIRHKADWDYINTLLILIGMNTNTQATFGNGNIRSYVSTSNTGILTTGTMNDKGLFYGKNDNVSGVKVFGIENWWGNMWVSIAGWNLVNGVQKIKMSYDQSDVSSVDGFNVTDGTGFATVSNSTPSGTNGGYISDWTIGDFGLIPTVASGASDKRLCDGLWFNNSANCCAFCGGTSGGSVPCGAFYAHLSNSASFADWGVGAALSYKPLSA